MAAMVRMGAHVSIAEDQAPLGTSPEIVETTDPLGQRLVKTVPSEPGRVLAVVHFIDLDGGSRVTSESFGELLLDERPDATLDELRRDVRELILLDEANLLQALHEQGVTADEAAVNALPFEIEFEDSVTEEFS